MVEVVVVMVAGEGGCTMAPVGCFDFVTLQEAVRTALGRRVSSQYSHCSTFLVGG